MRTDGQIKQDILDELVFQPHIDETQIGVQVEDGVVVLTGIVDDYHKKIAAERAVKKVLGVKAVAEDIEVKYGTNYQKTDKEIAKAIVAAFEWNTAVPEDKIHIEVRNGWVFLTGEVDYAYQKEAGKRVTGNILGVKDVVNNVTIKQWVKPKDVEKKIYTAFERLADIDANNIVVDVDGHRVRLQGKVNSISERDNAQSIAYKTPGVVEVKNDLEVIGIAKHILYDEFID